MGFRNIIFFTAILLLGILVSSGEAKQYGDILVEASSPPNVQRSHGYTEYRVSVSNRSAGDRHQVTLILPQQGYSGGTVTRTVSVEPSSATGQIVYCRRYLDERFLRTGSAEGISSRKRKGSPS